MQISPRHIPEAGVLICTVSGALETEKVRAFFKGLFADPDIASNVDIVWDIRAFDFSTARPAEIRQLAEDRAKVDTERTGSRYAFVVTDPAQEILVKLYWAHARNIDQEKDIFRSVDAAVSWLCRTRRG